MKESFFAKELDRFSYTPVIDKMEFFEDDWKNLGYKNPKVKLKNYRDRDICEMINHIIRKYINYKKVNEYPICFNEDDKKAFDEFVEFFEVDEISWLYRCLPKNLKGKPPFLFAANKKVMKDLRRTYLDFVLALRKNKGF